MRFIPVFFSCAAAAVVYAQSPTFFTGQAARLVIGQTTFTSQDTNSSDTTLGSASGIAYGADTLFVADSNRVGASPSNNRVLLFSNLSSQLPQPTAELPYNTKCPVCVGKATLVLGQPDFVTTTQNNAATANSLRTPTNVATDGVHLVVADTDHNRVLIWNHIPTTNNQPDRLWCRPEEAAIDDRKQHARQVQEEDIDEAGDDRCEDDLTGRDVMHCASFRELCG